MLCVCPATLTATYTLLFASAGQRRNNQSVVSLFICSYCLPSSEIRCFRSSALFYFRRTEHGHRVGCLMVVKRKTLLNDICAYIWETEKREINANSTQLLFVILECLLTYFCNNDTVWGQMLLLKMIIWLVMVAVVVTIVMVIVMMMRVKSKNRRNWLRLLFLFTHAQFFRGNSWNSNGESRKIHSCFWSCIIRCESGFNLLTFTSRLSRTFRL